MAVIALTILLAAAVFGRTITSYITTSVGAYEPMIHVIVNSRSEAYQVMARIMLLMQNKGRGHGPTMNPREEEQEHDLEYGTYAHGNADRVTRRDILTAM